MLRDSLSSTAPSNRPKNGRVFSRLRYIFKYLVFSASGLSDEERLFASQWQKDASISFILLIARAGFWFFPAAAIASYLFAPNFVIGLCLISCTVLTAITWLVSLNRHKWRGYLRHGFTFISLILVITCSFLVKFSFSDWPGTEIKVMTTSCFITSIILSIGLFQFHGPVVFLWAALHIGLGLFAFQPVQGIRTLDLVALLLLISLISIGLYYSWLYRNRQRALIEFAARTMLVNAEQNRRALLQTEMNLGSETQDSYGQGAQVVQVHGFEVATYVKKYDSLGGDWSSCVTMKNGDVVIFVADASGKGVQAALVIHALQALWANASIKNDFDPIFWLNDVNQALRRMGQRKDHTLTLGLILIRQDIVSYYSAGHPPLFVIADGEAGQEVTTLLGRGNILGMNDSLDLSPTTLNLKEKRVQAMFLGTDGVFSKGVRTRKKDILRLLSTIALKGAGVLDDFVEQDDKLLVWLKVKAA